MKNDVISYLSYECETFLLLIPFKAVENKQKVRYIIKSQIQNKKSDTKSTSIYHLFLFEIIVFLYMITYNVINETTDISYIYILY